MDDDQLPVVRLRVGVTNRLDGKIVHGPIDFASVAAGDVNKVVCESETPRSFPSSLGLDLDLVADESFRPPRLRYTGTMDYEIEKTTMDEEGYTVARKGLGVARKRYTNMTSLNLPTGKSVGDMKGKGEDSAGAGGKVGAGMLKDGNGKTSTNTSTTTTTTTITRNVDEGVQVTLDNKEINKDKEEKRAHLKWKSPDGRILALRKLARESGKEYEERISGTKGKKAVVWRP